MRTRIEEEAVRKRKGGNDGEGKHGMRERSRVGKVEERLRGK